MSGTVTFDQLEKLNYVIGPKATSLAASVIRLHSADNEEKKWVYTGLCGALCFIIDRQLGGASIFRMYDLNSFDQLFEAELYYEFETRYTELNDNFYCFPIPGNHYIAFSFADSEEALLFKSLVGKYCPKNSEKKLTTKRRVWTLEESVSEKKPGFFKKLFSKKQQSLSDELEDIDNAKISRPENAVHENHIGWDIKNQTFDLSQLSKELKRVFKKAGIRKKDLKDTNTALLIADAILNQPALDSKKKGKKGAEKSVVKKDETSLDGGNLAGLTRRASSQSLSQINNGDIKKPGFRDSMVAGNLSKQDEISLTSKLATAIAQRRKQLTKHDVESEEDDWSDEDA